MKPIETAFTIEKPKKEATPSELEAIAESLLSKHRKTQKDDYNFWEDVLGKDDYKKFINLINTKSYTVEVIWGNSGFKKIKIDNEKLFCPYCGNKKSFIVDTDINSGMICKNILCKNYNHND